MSDQNVKKESFRTDIESLLLEEMVEEDANYLIMGDYDSDIENIIPDDALNNNGLFGNSSSNLVDDDSAISNDTLYDKTLF